MEFISNVNLGSENLTETDFEKIEVSESSYNKLNLSIENTKIYDINKKKIKLEGKFLGEGATGIVVSNPRLPLNNEYIENLVENNEVSKIFKFKYDYNYEIEFFEINNYLNNSIISEYLVLPLGHAIIHRSDIDSFKIKYSDKIKQVNLLMCLDEQENIYHIVFPKGQSIYKTTYHPLKFMCGIQNIIKCILILNDSDLFLPDLKIQNIVDTYDYSKDKISHKLNLKSSYKLIDYTTIISINSENIDYALELLFFTEHNFFHCGFDYSSFPSYPILLLRYLIGNVNIDVNIDNLEENIIASQIFEEKIKNEDIIYDDLHIYLLEFLSENTFLGMTYINKIFTLDINKFDKFSFNINLYNTTKLEYVDLEINCSNIINVMNQLYYEKLGYVDINHKLQITNLSDQTVDPNVKEEIYIQRDFKIKEYLIYFNIWARFFLKYNINISKTDIKNMLLKNIQKYSFGIIIFDFISNFYRNKTKYDSVFYKLLVIAINSCLIQYYDPKTGDLLLNNNNFNDINDIYYDFMQKKFQ